MTDERYAMHVLERIFGASQGFSTRVLVDSYAKRAFVGYFSARGRTLNEIGRYIRRDHATVYWHKKQFIDEYEHNKYFKQKYQEFTNAMLLPREDEPAEVYHF